jgi:hypothetical protein
MTLSNSSYEGKLIRFGTVIFWVLFWFFNVIDKFINEPIFLFAGKDRISQFQDYFSSIGIEDPSISFGFLIFVTLAEIIALILVALAFLSLVTNRKQKAHSFFFWGTFTGLAIFSFFTIGDQIFGDRSELLEHTIFWVALIVSWGAYTYFPKEEL